ncbi:hypothetical protein A6V39_04460 [Candidatus Mycoplasma haematobovis]|uniref:Uncharacterized protein n=1 Tax=Candidatus Mycoplasma haematobovis TaxID=432608 RepID=A0A1A9QCE0_9MOLU|nr:hypothetical protein [Candidatus Mycoplasma haematobovis]OAL10137.1 hypothetical protein A6V39_04460 [Candidatus Mycoplasma haematobovis]
MSIGTKILIGAGSVGSVAGAGATINYFYGGDSIKVHIQKKNKTSNKIFLTSDNKDLAEIEKKYTASSESTKRPKPKKKGKVIEAKDLGKWCEKAVENKFSGEDNYTYKEIMSWCYININSFEKELKNDNKKIATETADNKVWTDAWTGYSREKTKPVLKITGSTNDSELNGNDQTAGAKILHTWCNSKKAIKLYEDNAEETYALFVKWCPTTKAE